MGDEIIVISLIILILTGEFILWTNQISGEVDHKLDLSISIRKSNSVCSDGRMKEGNHLSSCLSFFPAFFPVSLFEEPVSCL